MTQLFVGANIGLALSRNIGVIMFFRFMQAAGSSSTISIGDYAYSNHDSHETHD